ncbi:MAG: S-methyl-5-thioribose-1-phosphate isomerase [Elusimicrobiota bacterium]
MTAEADRLRDKVSPIRRDGDAMLLLDQLELPHLVVYRRYSTPAAVADAIRRMVLRGAPLIGCAAAYGYAFGAKGARKPSAAVLKRLETGARLLLASRPTAVNLSWAVARMRSKARALASEGSKDFFRELLAEADRITREDIAANRRMAWLGAKLLGPRSTVITHCNAGALATAGIGTALGMIRAAHLCGKIRLVYARETRPYLQGSRLTLWELMREGIPSSLITDSMAAHLMKTERIDAVIVGSDRIAANADVANKIGTYGLAILAREHRVPFYVVAPSTTVDLNIPSGNAIPIEERSAREVLEVRGRRAGPGTRGKAVFCAVSIAPKGALARHPAFDVTPHRLVSAIVTEKGVVRPADGLRLRRVMRRP